MYIDYSVEFVWDKYADVLFNVLVVEAETAYEAAKKIDAIVYEHNNIKSILPMILDFEDSQINDLENLSKQIIDKWIYKMEKLGYDYNGIKQRRVKALIRKVEAYSDKITIDIYF